MAVAPTGAIYKALKFDNVSSRTYGVYITGEAVYNAPERDVEMITIPGRNGSFALDNGRFENIEVSYPAGIFADTEVDFRQAISDFRNFLCSRNGYVRLQDEYNPDEYRMAVYKSGLEVDPAMLKAGEFEITFDCKPQRYLTSGETKQTISSSGDTITNPTLFDARPMVEATGYGTLTVNGSDIEIDNAMLGEIQLLPLESTILGSDTETTFTITGVFDKNLVNIGDTITLNSKIPLGNVLLNYYGSMYAYTNIVLDSAYTVNNRSYTSTNTTYAGTSVYYGNKKYDVFGISNAATFTVGTASTVSASVVGSYPTYSSNNLLVETAEVSIVMTLSYDGDDTITATLVRSISNDTYGLWTFEANAGTLRRALASANSTVSLLGNPTYIDCDLGTCYKIVNDSIIDLNPYIDLGSNMPELKSGSNVITFDNTYTKIDIIPRWWKV